MPSTMPMPEGVGETMRKRYEMAKPQTMVLKVNGTWKDENDAMRIAIINTLAAKAKSRGLIKLR